MAVEIPVVEPIPISLVSSRYLLYDINVISYLRRAHNISGVLIGTLPQTPHQNVFLGLPLELLPEEARLLVEKNVAYIVDDAAAHDSGIVGLSEEEETAFRQALRLESSKESKAVEAVKEGRKRISLGKKKRASGQEKTHTIIGGERDEEPSKADVFLFDSPAAHSQPAKPSAFSMPEPAAQFNIIPSTSTPPLSYQPPSPPLPVPLVPTSYSLFRYLHSKGYFLSPGLRFGCQYMAYPGDPLRFHSHFLAVGKDWDEELDLLDVVAGGRLGTGVKKGYLIGGEVGSGRAKGKVNHGELTESGSEGDVRAFSIEWAGM
ncbi:SEN34 subunit of tRNA-splicing endonuclease [Aulographum hederae CBS 113979]|uniref:tRNA-splicing endonuclease subunit Sen34 n=1 Tax=Aulographum hederae CBS 113979 TaxID=1176131 RepID=A0A6G1GN00_9PEZI|nr:SEN34 subunit of tRNA-splicing endonuclease [Aulographum hederae CBS 113979]